MDEGFAVLRAKNQMDVQARERFRHWLIVTVHKIVLRAKQRIGRPFRA